MAKKYKNITHGKVGDIIYPAYNGTIGFWNKSRWDVVMRVDKNGLILDRSCLWDYSSVRAIQVMQKLLTKEKGRAAPVGAAQTVKTKKAHGGVSHGKRSG